MNASNATRSAVSRRTLLSGSVGAAGAAIGLAGCGSGKASGTPSAAASAASSVKATGELRVGHFAWVGNLFKDWIDELITRFCDEHKGMTVKMIPVAAADASTEAFVQKLALEARQNQSTYDLILGPTPWIQVGALVRASALRPVSEFVTGAYGSNLAPSARTEATSGDGKMYCLPFWSDVVGFMDRPSLQAKYNVKAPQTWSDLTAQVAAGGLPNDVYHYGADWTQLHRFFLPIMAAYTDKVFLPSGVIDMASPAALKALEVMKALIPGMPVASSTPGKHLDSFYAGQTLSQTYWQTGVRAAVTNGLPANDVTYRKNLTADRDGTFFWTTTGIIPKASALPEMAAAFVTEGISGDWGVQKSAVVSQTVPPMIKLKEKVPNLPAQAELAASQLGSAIGLPANDAWLSIENPAFKTATERMMADKRNPADVQQELVAAFAKYK